MSDESDFEEWESDYGSEFEEMDESKFQEILERVRSNDPTLSRLNLGNSRIGNDRATELAKALKVNKTITKINLSGNNIGDYGATELAKALKVNKTITKIDLSYNEIGNDGATELAKALMVNATIMKIYLPNNNIGKDGATELAKALKVNTAITNIVLSGNKIGKDGATELAKALKVNTAITNINLSENNIGDDGATELAEALKENKTVTEIVLGEVGMSLAIELAQRMEWNKTFQKHQNAIKEIIGDEISFYVNVCMSTGAHTEGAAVMWSDNAWEAATGDGRAFLLLMQVLQVFISAHSQVKEDIKDLVDNDKNKEGSTILHLVAARESLHAFEFCQFLVDEVGANIDGSVDDLGRTVRQIGIASLNADTSGWIKSVGTFFGRYVIEGGQGLRSPPAHKSQTCTVFFATDVLKKRSDSDYHVALKIMKREDQFKRELEALLIASHETIGNGKDVPGDCNRFDEDHVVPLVRFHDGPDPQGNKAVHYRILVLLQGARNLHQIIDAERIAARDEDKIYQYGLDLAKAIQHLHKKGFIHGDVKPRNVIRAFDGDLKLIDLDATVKVKHDLTEKYSSGYITPEIARQRFSPKEDMEELKVNLEELKTALRNAEADDEFERLTKDINELRQKVKAIESTPAGRSAEASAMASQALDIWAFGATIYYLCTGRPLMECSPDNDDNLASESECLRLINWAGLSEEDLRLVLRHCSNEKEVEKAKAFLQRCLDGDPEQRHQTMEQVVQDPFFSREGSSLVELKKTVDRNYEKLDRIHEISRSNQRKLDEIDRRIEGVATTLDQMQQQLILFQKATTRMLKDIIKAECAPKYVCMIPKKPDEGWKGTLSHWCHPENWVSTKIIFYFICPVTLECCGEGYEIPFTKDWVEKYGPAIRTSLTVLKLACGIGRLAGLPIPNITDLADAVSTRFQEETAFLTGLWENVTEKLDQAGLDNIPKFVDEKMSSFQGELSAAGDAVLGDEGSPSGDVHQGEAGAIIHQSYDHVKGIAASQDDRDFRKTGLEKVTCDQDGTTEYVKASDPRVVALYRKKGQNCIGLSPSELLRQLQEVGDDDTSESALYSNIAGNLEDAGPQSTAQEASATEGQQQGQTQQRTNQSRQETSGDTTGCCVAL